MERGIYTPLDIPSFQLPFLNSLLIANIPQLVLTFTYYCYNNVLTSMLAAAEYSTYGDSSKPLRVSRPEKDSEQKSTCWLSIPYHYAVPMLLFSTVLHWLISQSFYYISITPDPSEGLGTYSTRSLAYSPLAIFVAILVGALMIFILLCLCFRRFTSRVSLAGTCSAAISAACHPPRDEDLDTAALGQLKWGETVEPPVWAVGRLEGTGNKGHCSFTSMETTKPLATRLYA